MPGVTVESHQEGRRGDRPHAALPHLPDFRRTRRAPSRLADVVGVDSRARTPRSASSAATTRSARRWRRRCSRPCRRWRSTSRWTQSSPTSPPVAVRRPQRQAGVLTRADLQHLAHGRAAAGGASVQQSAQATARCVAPTWLPGTARVDGGGGPPRGIHDGQEPDPARGRHDARLPDVDLRPGGGRRPQGLRLLAPATRRARRSRRASPRSRAATTASRSPRASPRRRRSSPGRTPATAWSAGPRRLRRHLPHVRPGLS